MAGGKIKHWKHGWIPLDAYARAVAKSKERTRDLEAADAQYKLEHPHKSLTQRITEAKDRFVAEHSQPTVTSGIESVVSPHLSSSDVSAYLHERSTTLSGLTAAQRKSMAEERADILAQAEAAKRASKEDARRARYAAHLQETAGKRDAMRKRYNAARARTKGY